MSYYTTRNGRRCLVRDDNTIIDVLTGAAVGFATDALMGGDDNGDGALLGALAGGLGLGLGGAVVGGLLGGLFDD